MDIEEQLKIVGRRAVPEKLRHLRDSVASAVKHANQLTPRCAVFNDLRRLLEKWGWIE